MTNVYDYMFHNISRSINDNVTVSARDVQNNSYGEYSVTNFNEHDDNKPLHLSVSQPNVFMTGGKNTVGTNGIVVDKSNSLRNSMLTNPRGRISLFPRPFSSVPFIGKGPYDVDQEFLLKNGDSVSNRKTVHGISEMPFTDYHHYPLIDSIQSTITNPNNLVEKGIRGGDNTRNKKFKE